MAELPEDFAADDEPATANDLVRALDYIDDTVRRRYPRMRSRRWRLYRTLYRTRCPPRAHSSPRLRVLRVGKSVERRARGVTLPTSHRLFHLVGVGVDDEESVEHTGSSRTARPER